MSAADTSIRDFPPVLHARALGCTYTSNSRDLIALRDVTFELKQAERLAILGESGAGKSTLLRCLNLLAVPTSGDIEFNGRSLRSLSEHELTLARRQIGMIFQHFALLHRRTVRENVALPLELAGLSRAQISSRVDELLARVRLSEKADVYPAQLSGGQRQRVGIARALAHAPRVLLCDEPTSALDTETARHVVALLDELSDELGLTIVFVTHQLELVRALATTVAVLEGGELREFTPVTDFFAQPRSAAGQRLLAPEAPRLPPKLVAEARNHAGIGRSTLLTFAISASDAAGAVFGSLAHHPSLRFEVVAADIESSQGIAAGSLTVLVHGEPATIREAISALEQQAINVEVVGHVSSAA